MNESILKDKKYLSGVLTGFILGAIVILGINRYQETRVLVEDEDVIQNNQEEVIDNLPIGEIGESKEDVVKNVSLNTNAEMTPETPHSPELQRLDLILREAGRMIDRMNNDIAKIDGTQTAVVSQ